MLYVSLRWIRSRSRRMCQMFAAKYAGKCAYSGDRINVGDQITYNANRQVVHATVCGQSAEAAADALDRATEREQYAEYIAAAVADTDLHVENADGSAGDGHETTEPGWCLICAHGRRGQVYIDSKWHMPVAGFVRLTSVVARQGFNYLTAAARLQPGEAINDVDQTFTRESLRRDALTCFTAAVAEGGVEVVTVAR